MRDIRGALQERFGQDNYTLYKDFIKETVTRLAAEHEECVRPTRCVLLDLCVGFVWVDPHKH